MITKEQSIELVKEYITKRNRKYIRIVPAEKVLYEEQKEIAYGKYEDSKKNIFIVTYYVEGYFEEIPYFVVVDAFNAEVLFTSYSKGYVEDTESLN
jgi:hypothetical protein